MQSTTQTLSSLQQQRAHIEQRQSEMERLTADFESAVGAAEAELERVFGMELRGTATPTMLKEAESVVATACRELDTHRARKRIISNESQKLDYEIAQAKSAVEQERLTKCKELSGVIEAKLRGDKKLRCSLLEIFGLWQSVAGLGGAARWDGILLDIFPEPDGAEYDAAVSQASKRLG